MAKQDDYTRYTIRIPTPLYERVKSAAGEKSVNAEIVETLEEKYPAPKGYDETNMLLLLLGSVKLSLTENKFGFSPEEQQAYFERIQSLWEEAEKEGAEDASEDLQLRVWDIAREVTYPLEHRRR